MLLGSFSFHTGILQMVMWPLVVLVTGFGVGITRENRVDTISNVGVGVVGCGILTGIPFIVFHIMMWVAAFESHKECGPTLWNFAVVTVIVTLLQLWFNCRAPLQECLAKYLSI